MFGRLLPSLFSTVQRFTPLVLPSSSFHSLTATALPAASSPWCLMPVRNKVRCYFPRPNETMRIKKHGWLKRLSTLDGRKTLMRRYLKGRHVLSH